MSRTHEVPNHLNVQDTLFLGLTARQIDTFMQFASPAYGIWDQLTVAPPSIITEVISNCPSLRRIPTRSGRPSRR